MNKTIMVETEIAGKKIRFEAGLLAQQAAGSVVAYLDDEEAKDAIEEELASGMGAGAALVYAQQMQQEQDPDADPNKNPQGNGGNNQPQ